MTQQLLFANKYRYATYTQVKNENKVWGIDLSHHQDIIDWEKLKEQPIVTGKQIGRAHV